MRPTTRALPAAGVLALLLTSGCAGNGQDTDASTSADGTPSASASATASAAPSTSGAANQQVLAATQAFVATLEEDQQTDVVAERTEANLAQWSNLPDELFERAGLRMDSLSGEQQDAAMAVLQAALSPEGYTQVTQISTADGVLAESGGPALDFGADHYWIRLVGEPSATEAYTIQYGGHHLAVNVTVVGSQMTLAPMLWGAQPASYEQAGSTVEPMSGETTKAFAVMGALDATQQQAATLTTPVQEIVLGAGQDGKTPAAEGVRASTFTVEQRQLLLELVREWLRPLNEESAAAKLTTAEAELDQTTFAWYGETTIGNPVYYRVQAPSYVIEFAHQQGQGANAGGVTHIHSIYREIGNDYGAQLGK